MSTMLQDPAVVLSDTSSIQIDELVITDEDLMDVQMRTRMDVGH